MTIKDFIRRNFLYYAISAIVIAIQFFTYLTNSPQVHYMDGLGFVFFVGAVLSHAAIVALIPYLLGIVTKIVCKKDSIASIIHVFLIIVLNLVILINGYVYAQYRFHINGLILSMLFGEGSNEIFHFDIILYLKVTAIVCLIIIGNIILKKLANRLYDKQKRIYWIPFLALFLTALVSSNFIHAYAAVVQRQSVVKSAEHLPYYFPITATRLMISLGVVSQNDLLDADFGQKSELHYPQNEIVSNGGSKQNIVIIAIDAWNYRTLNDTVMPHVYSFAQKNTQFTDHLSSSNGTRGGIFGLFFGVTSYYWKDFDITGTTPVLIDELNRQNYTIRTFPSATMNNPNFAKVIFHKTKGITPSTEGNSAYERDCRLTDNFLSFLDSTQAEQPFFAFLFYDLAHSYDYPKHLKKHFTPSWEYADFMKLNNDMDPTPFWNLYCNCVYTVDSLVNVVLTALSEKHLDNTTIIITGDHGQEFNENHKNYWGHNSNYTYPQIHVPLIVHNQSNTPKTFSHRTTHYDVSTTLLKNVLGVTNDEKDFGMGLNLYDTTFRNWHIVGDNINYAFIIDDNIIVEKKPAGRLEIYDKELNPLPDYRPSAKEISDAIQKVNQFHESGTNKE